VTPLSRRAQATVETLRVESALNRVQQAPHTDKAATSQAWLQALSPLSFLERSSFVFGDKVAVIDGARRFTYAEFAAEAMRLARALKAAGLQRGERVAFMAFNTAEMLVAHFAVPLAGGVLVAINTRLSPDEVAYICTHSEAKMVFASSELAHVAERAVSTVPSIRHRVALGDGAAEPWMPYEDFCAGASSADLSWEITDELSPIAINYTSGTTGRPKGVVYSHRGAYLNSLGEMLHSQHSSRSVYLWTLPMFHCNGWCTAWAVTGIGGTHVCLPQVRGPEIWRLIDEHGVTHLNGAPAVLSVIAEAAEAHQVDHGLVVTTAGAAPSPAVIAKMEDLGARVIHVYGLTEVYGPYSVCEWQDGWEQLPQDERCRLLARQGVGMIQAERLRVVDENMRDVPADGETIGEIVMRGNNVMLGYLDDLDATDKAFAGGWFHSGDLGVMHQDGYVELRDRAKDIIISGGENISTIEVESSLLSHSAVVEAAVVGIPDDRWGERPTEFVVLRAGERATEAELIQHVRARIAHFKAPDHVDFLPALPRTSTGKVQKDELRRRGVSAPSYVGTAS
jgi:fatty-acyl-CoA synthase